MPESLIEAAAQLSSGTDRRVYGVAPAVVLSCLDSKVQGRVQIKLPWLPGFEPWARVAMPSSGSGRGVYFMPQEGDEVLVAFDQGDVREPFVLGSLWNGRDKPPVDAMTDAVGKRVIETPAGHSIVLDDTAQSIDIETTTGHKVHIEPQKLELSAGQGATVTLEQAGSVTIKAQSEIKLDASVITIEGQGVNVTGNAINLDSDAVCAITGNVVKLN